MPRSTPLLCATLALVFTMNGMTACADGSVAALPATTFSPRFTKSSAGMTPCQHKSLARFLQRAEKEYYGKLSNLDRVSYYRSHGYQINAQPVRRPPARPVRARWKFPHCRCNGVSPPAAQPAEFRRH